MKHPPIKFHQGIRPGAILDAAAPSLYHLDLANYPGAVGILWVFNFGATDVAPSVMKIQEAAAASNSTTLTTPSDLHDFTTKPGTGSDGGIFGVYVKLDKARKRYQGPAFTAGNGTAGTYVQCEAVIIGGDHNFDASSYGFTVFEEAA